MTSEPLPPFERFYDLNRLSEAGFETDIELRGEELAKLAAWADVVSVNKFQAHITLEKLTQSRFAYAASIDADITQNCTVTLEPVRSAIVLEFKRVLHLVSHARRVVDYSGELAPGAAEDEAPEEIDDPRYDLAAPLLEEFLLAIDRYPRAPDAVFEPPVAAEAEAAESPFAVLKDLKAKG